MLKCSVNNSHSQTTSDRIFTFCGKTLPTRDFSHFQMICMMSEKTPQVHHVRLCNMNWSIHSAWISLHQQCPKVVATTRTTSSQQNQSNTLGKVVSFKLDRGTRTRLQGVYSQKVHSRRPLCYTSNYYIILFFENWTFQRRLPINS